MLSLSKHNLHLPAALGTNQRVHLIDHLNERGPHHFSLMQKPGLSLDCRLLPFPVEPPLLVGVPAIIPDLVLSLVRDVLGDLGEKIQRLEYLEIPGDAGNQLLLAARGIRQGVLLDGPVNDLAVPVQADDALSSPR